MSEEVIEAEVVDGGELVPRDHSNLFHTTDPAEVLQRATETANALMPVVREKGLIAQIKSRQHLTVEAWQTLGAMLGVTPVCTWTRQLDNGWEARVEARTLDGRVIGAAEAECLRSESAWKSREDFALRSMAQTRATSKALASVLRFVATLAGLEGTPAEEMSDEKPAETRPAFTRANEEQLRLAKKALGALVGPERAFDVWKTAVEAFGGTCPAPVAQMLIDMGPVPEQEIPADTEGL